jgi:hypothetical protein
MFPSIHLDFPPLLSPGFHIMNLERLHWLTVERAKFRLSKTRPEIMRNLWIVAGSLCQMQITGELWVNGSFLTEKIDPRDVDFLVVLTEGFRSTISPQQQAVLEWLCEDTAQLPKSLLKCDAYGLYKAHPQDPDYPDYVALDAYWKSQFGISRQREPKGMALIPLPGGCS